MSEVQNFEGAEAVTQGNAVKPIERFREALGAQKDKILKVLPAHITFEKFQSVVMMACMSNPALLTADRPSLLFSCVKAATDGLLPDGREAQLVIFNAKLGYKDDSGRDVYGPKVQYMPMYYGILKKVRQSGELASIAAHVVYEKDKFHYTLGDEEKIVHEPFLGGDRGEIIAAYCIARLKDGSEPMRLVMTKSEIEKVRKTSKSGSDKSGNATGIWLQWYDQMSLKTVFRRLAKWLPQSIDKDGVVRVFDNDDTMDVIDNTVDGSYTKEDDGQEIEGGSEVAQIDHRQEMPQPDLNAAIQEKEKVVVQEKKKVEAKEERTPPRSAFDIETAIRTEIKTIETSQELLEKIEGAWSKDLSAIQSMAPAAHKSLVEFINAKMDKLNNA